MIWIMTGRKKRLGNDVQVGREKMYRWIERVGGHCVGDSDVVMLMINGSEILRLPFLHCARD